MTEQKNNPTDEQTAIVNIEPSATQPTPPADGPKIESDQPETTMPKTPEEAGVDQTDVEDDEGPCFEPFQTPATVDQADFAAQQHLGGIR